MGAVALVNLRFFFEVEEVHGCCRARSAVLLGCLVFLQCASVHAAIIRVDAMNSQRLMRAMTSQLFDARHFCRSAKPLLASSNTLAEAEF